MRVRPLGSLALIRRAAREGVMHADPLDNEDSIFDLDLAIGG